MNEIKCPFCDELQAGKPLKSWKYSNGAIEVKRYSCSCGEEFNFYKSSKKTWTIPKPTGKEVRLKKLKDKIS